jgi:hypothetical protein
MQREAQPQDVQLTLYAPHSAQQTIHASRATYRVATCGRRWGKTLMGANELIKGAVEVPDSDNWWVAPVFKQTEVAYRMVEKALMSMKPNLVKRHQKSLDRFILFNDARIEFHSIGNDPDRLRGPGLNKLVGDECSMWNRKVWEEILWPTLADRLGTAILIGTPKGRNWFYEVWQRGQKGLRGDPAHSEWASWKFPSSSNPYLSARRIAEVKSKLPQDVFRQEWEAEFLEESAGVFRGIMSCVYGPWNGNEAPIPGHSYALGWDVAKYTNFSVFSVIDRATRRLVAWDRFNKVDWSYQLAKLNALCATYHPKVIMDATGAGDPLVSQVRSMITGMGLALEPIVFTNELKQQIVENLAITMEQRHLSYPNIPELLEELQIFQYEFTKSRNIVYSAPEGFDDDCVISLALALWGCTGARFFEGIETPSQNEVKHTNPQEGWIFNPVTRQIEYPSDALSPFRSVGGGRNRPLF